MVLGFVVVLSELPLFVTLLFVTGVCVCACVEGGITFALSVTFWLLTVTSPLIWVLLILTETSVFSLGKIHLVKSTIPQPEKLITITRSIAIAEIGFANFFIEKSLLTYRYKYNTKKCACHHIFTKLTTN